MYIHAGKRHGEETVRALGTEIAADSVEEGRTPGQAEAALLFSETGCGLEWHRSCAP